MEKASARDRLLDTAAELFYREGVRAIGVDLVVERSGVAKTSLYRHFPSKDELVVAFLEREDAAYWRDWESLEQAHAQDPAAELAAHVEWIGKYVCKPDYRGCAFLNVATEFPAPDHPARQVALRHKKELARRMEALTKRMKVKRPQVLAAQLVLLIDGAYVNGQLFGKRGPAQLFAGAAEALIGAGQA
ncbi:MAG: TetR/AcrR family transcriptional regulator [Polaromonas sp.]|uniref:TetR/AcrR family transcriptional regulator n=1 Tax=Polaromonas sp. TaxID=1869339 RepID=UPI003265A3F2